MFVNAAENMTIPYPGACHTMMMISMRVNFPASLYHCGPCAAPVRRTIISFKIPFSGLKTQFHMMATATLETM